MTIFDVIEKQQKSRFFFSFFFFIKIIVANPKVNIHSKIQSHFQLRSDFFLLLFFAGVELQPLILVHTDLASVFNITTALHAGK